MQQLWPSSGALGERGWWTFDPSPTWVPEVHFLSSEVSDFGLFGLFGVGPFYWQTNSANFGGESTQEDRDNS